MEHHQHRLNQELVTSLSVQPSLCKCQPSAERGNKSYLYALGGGTKPLTETVSYGTNIVGSPVTFTSTTAGLKPSSLTFTIPNVESISISNYAVGGSPALAGPKALSQGVIFTGIVLGTGVLSFALPEGLVAGITLTVPGEEIAAGSVLSYGVAAAAGAVGGSITNVGLSQAILLGTQGHFLLSNVPKEASTGAITGAVAAPIFQGVAEAIEPLIVKYQSTEFLSLTELNTGAATPITINAQTDSGIVTIPGQAKSNEFEVLAVNTYKNVITGSISEKYVYTIGSATDITGGPLFGIKGVNIGITTDTLSQTYTSNFELISTSFGKEPSISFGGPALNLKTSQLQEDFFNEQLKFSYDDIVSGKSQLGEVPEGQTKIEYVTTSKGKFSISEAPESRISGLISSKATYDIDLTFLNNPDTFGVSTNQLAYVKEGSFKGSQISVSDIVGSTVEGQPITGKGVTIAGGRGISLTDLGGISKIEFISSDIVSTPKAPYNEQPFAGKVGATGQKNDLFPNYREGGIYNYNRFANPSSTTTDDIGGGSQQIFRTQKLSASQSPISAVIPISGSIQISPQISSLLSGLASVNITKQVTKQSSKQSTTNVFKSISSTITGTINTTKSITTNKTASTQITATSQITSLITVPISISATTTTRA